mmetsp:Transcript_34057/g.74428  ORF Transcript_34057/g.74428 Transcript_34057/m.74428 type:complete len:356 (-) Transcript_34057:195-1262(-)
MHSSLSFLSWVSSSFRAWIMVSMLSMILSKWPPAFKAEITEVKAVLRVVLAFLVSTARALARTGARVSESTCTNVATALVNNLRASSESKISMALSMPSISSSLSLVRSVHSLALSVQDLSASWKNFWSAASCSEASSLASMLMLRMRVASACSPCFLVSTLRFSLSSSFLSSMNCSKSFCLLDSSIMLFSMFTAKVSYMSFRIPWTVADCGEYWASWVGFWSKDSMVFVSLSLRRAAGITRTTEANTAIRSPLPVPAPESRRIAFSRAPTASSISPFSAWKAAFSFSRSWEASFWAASVSLMSLRSLPISLSRVSSFPLVSRILFDKLSILVLPKSMLFTFRSVVFSHQQAYLL